MSHKKSLFVQNTPGDPQSTQQSRPNCKKRFRAKLFKFVFNVVEGVWMLVQIVHYIYEMLGK